MTQSKPKKATGILALSLLITAVTIGSILTALFSGLKKPQENDNTNNQDRLSLGEKILVTAETNPNKQAGVQAFANKDLYTAHVQFEASIKAHPNDPEGLIYFNNSPVTSNISQTKIVVSVPIGSNLNVAQEILRGVAQAQQETNQHGGINGKLLQVAIANDENDSTIAKKLATDFVNDPNIIAVIGHNASNASLAACPIYEQGKLVMMSPTSYAQNLSGCGAYIFRSIPSVRFIADPLVHYMIQIRKSNIAICVDQQAPDNVSFVTELQSAIFAENGKYIPIACDLSAAKLEPQKVISEAVSAGANSLVLAPHVDRIEKALEIAAANKGRLALFGSPTLYTSLTLKSGQENINDLVLAVPWHPSATPGNPFAENARTLWGGTVNWRTAMAYDATIAVIQGLQQSYNRQELQAILHNPNFSANGATGKIEFLPSGDRNGKALLVKVQPTNTQLGYDFFPLTPQDTQANPKKSKL